MLRIFLLGIFCQIYISGFSQHIISGVLKDIYNDKPISGAIISLSQAQTEKILSFYISDINGSFEMKVDSISNVKLKAAKIGYLTENNLPLESNLSIFLIPSVDTSLQFKLTDIEVVAKRELFGSKVEKKFEAKTYRDSINDRLEDLIDNLPGMQVDRKNGDIYYNNNRVKSVLLDGDNLTGEDYSSLTRYVSQNIAKNIEIIGNYSENLILRTFEKSNNYAINIETDSLYKNKISGNAAIGLDQKLSTQSELVLIGINKKLKFLVNGFITNGVLANTNIHNHQNRNSSLLISLPLSQNKIVQNSLGRSRYYTYFDNFGYINPSKTYNINQNSLFKISDHHKLSINTTLSDHTSDYRTQQDWTSLDTLQPNYIIKRDGFSRDKTLHNLFSYDGLLGESVQLLCDFDISITKANDLLTLNNPSNNLFSKSLNNKVVNHQFLISMAARVSENQGLVFNWSKRINNLSENTRLSDDQAFDYFIDDVLYSYDELGLYNDKKYGIQSIILQYVVKPIRNMVSTVSIENRSYQNVMNSSIDQTAFDVFNHQLFGSINEISFNNTYMSESLQLKFIIGNSFSDRPMDGNQINNLNFSIFSIYKNGLNGINFNASRKTIYQSSIFFSPFPMPLNETTFYNYNYDEVIMADNKNVSLSLSRDFVRKMQSLSLSVDYNSIDQLIGPNYIFKDNLILKDFVLLPTSNDRYTLSLKFDAYFRRLSHKLDIEVTYSLLDYLTYTENFSILNRNQSKNFKLKWKSSLRSKINYFLEYQIFHNGYSINSSEPVSFFNWNLSLGTKIKILNNLIMRMSYKVTDYSRTRFSLLSTELLYDPKGPLSFNFVIFNILDNAGIPSIDFQTNYKVTTNRLVGGRQFIFNLKYLL